MEQIKKCIDEGYDFSNDKIAKAMQSISDLGDVLLIKADGGREVDTYTVIILGIRNKFEPIRFDSAIMNDALVKALNRYLVEIHL
jgi:hypothetical protein